MYWKNVINAHLLCIFLIYFSIIKKINFKMIVILLINFSFKLMSVSQVLNEMITCSEDNLTPS